jgi:hypothetical protein
MRSRPVPALLLGLALAACGSSDDGGADAGTGDDAATPDDRGDAAPLAGDAALSDTADAGAPTYAAVIEPIPTVIRDEMIGRSWHEELDCPSLDELRLVRLSYWGFDGRAATGELIVAAAVAEDVAAAFGELFAARFPIAHIVRVDAYDGDDDASMADNNTSAFNCRAVTGGSALSQHSFGTAIDINPVQNPYQSGSLVLPPAAEAFVDRGDVRPGMIVRPGPVVDAFLRIGWHWGGDWSSPIDYQHVSQSGL